MITDELYSGGQEKFYKKYIPNYDSTVRTIVT